jgi:hypothetical protein
MIVMYGKIDTGWCTNESTALARRLKVEKPAQPAGATAGAKR